MDIRCPRCGEPWDMDSLHDAYDSDGRKLSFTEARRAFAKTGCAALGGSCEPDEDSEEALRSRVLFDLLGDDIDGIASLSSE